MTAPSHLVRRPSRGVRAALACGAVVVLALAGCSKDGSDGGSGGGAKRTTTTVARTTTTASGTTASTTTSAPGGTTTTVAGGTGGPSGPVRFRGTVEGTVDGKPATVTFTRNGNTITGFAVSKITVDCLPMGKGSATTRRVTASIPKLTVLDGAVDGAAKDAPYAPGVIATFTDDGAFTGTITFSGISADYSCGGEFSFTAEPA